MKVIKPQKLGLLTRTFEHDRRPFLVTTVLAFFPFGARTLLPEVALWKLVAAELGKDGVLDLGMPKAKPELLVTGKAYSPGGTPVPGFCARARIATVDKTLYVTGDRRWRFRVASEAEPITEMAITWANAFGGPGYALNPLGKGYAAQEDGEGEHPLPNIEDPNQLISGPRDRPPPAGFGAYDFMWPQRAGKLGTYDDAWLRERYPGFARDLSLAAFNTAPEDQHIDGYFDDEESFTLENLHPDKPTLEGKLPGIKARCFVNQKLPDGASLREVALRLETVHLFPNAERGVLLFRGMTEVADEEAADVLQIIVAGEDPREPRHFDHYRTVLDQRLDRKRGHIYALRDRDLLPPLDPAPRSTGHEVDDVEETEALLMTEGFLAKNLRRRAELEYAKAKDQIRAQGLDPDRYVPPLPPEEPPPDPEHVDEMLEGVLALAEQKRSEAEDLRAQAEEGARRQCAEHGIDFDKLIDEQRKKGGGPPKFSAQEQLQQLREAAELGRNAGVELTHVDDQLADPELETKLLAAERQLREAYVRFAHYFPAAMALGEDASRTVREEIVADHRAGKRLAGRDLTGANLSSLALERADLKGALMESVDLTGADLRGADLTDAVLARADLSGADLTGAILAGANLGSAKLCGTKLGGGVDLRRAVLTKADLTNADLRDARLEGADLSEAAFGGADLTGAHAAGLNLVSADLRGVRLLDADLTKSNFIEVDVSGVDMSGTTLTDAVFVSAKGDRAVFRGAKLDNLRLVKGCSFAGADFAGASLNGANLRGTNLAGADFTEARLCDADFSECDLREATFYLAVAPDSRFVKADLSRADMASANLMNAILQRAIVHGTDFEGANLFRADLFRLQVDGTTNIKDAELGQARFVEARRAHEQG